MVRITKIRSKEVRASYQAASGAEVEKLTDAEYKRLDKLTQEFVPEDWTLDNAPEFNDDYKSIFLIGEIPESAPPKIVPWGENQRMQIPIILYDSWEDGKRKWASYTLKLEEEEEISAIETYAGCPIAFICSIKYKKNDKDETKPWINIENIRGNIILDALPKAKKVQKGGNDAISV